MKILSGIIISGLMKQVSEGIIKTPGDYSLKQVICLDFNDLKVK
jgi:hypothetical protein